MGRQCGECCRDCCYSTPLLTLSVVCFTALGLVGFTLSGLYGVIKMDSIPHIQNGTVVMAPVVCGAIILTILPVVMATIMAYCVTGYIRDILFQSTIKSCIGSSVFNVIMMVTMIGYILLWIMVAIGLGGVMAYYIQAEIFCEQRNNELTPGMLATIACFYYVDTDFNYFPICEESDLNALCSREQGLSVGLAYVIALLFSVFVILGLVMLSLLYAHNYVSARDHIDYRENSRNEYDMKRVR